MMQNFQDTELSNSQIDLTFEPTNVNVNFIWNQHSNFFHSNLKLPSHQKLKTRNQSEVAANF